MCTSSLPARDGLEHSALAFAVTHSSLYRQHSNSDYILVLIFLLDQVEEHAVNYSCEKTSLSYDPPRLGRTFPRSKTVDIDMGIAS